MSTLQSNLQTMQRSCIIKPKNKSKKDNQIKTKSKKYLKLRN